MPGGWCGFSFAAFLGHDWLFAEEISHYIYWPHDFDDTLQAENWRISMPAIDMRSSRYQHSLKAYRLMQ
jgi:hypothetical protein